MNAQQIPQKDYSLHEVVKIQELAEQVRHIKFDDQLTLAVSSFKSNIVRISCHATLLPKVAGVFSLNQHVASAAEFNTYGTIDFGQSPKPQGKKYDEYKAECTRLTLQINEKLSASPRALDLAIMSDGIQQLCYEISEQQREKKTIWLTEGIEAVLAAIVIGAWATFESLTEDIWIQCLNARPGFAFAALGAMPDKDDSPEIIDQKNNKKIAIPVQLLRDANIDLNTQMGDLLSSTGDWSFVNRYRSKDAFHNAFGKNHSDVIKNIFDADGIRWLAATRNALVHCAGKADGEFLRLVKTHPQLGLIAEGHPISLDGYLVLELATAAFQQGSNLIAFASRRLADTRR